MDNWCVVFFFSSRRRHTRCALVTGFRRVLFRSNEARCKSLLEHRTEAAQAQWDRLIQPDISLIERMKIVGEFDRADEAEFNSLGSKAPFKVEGDLLYRTAYTQPSDISGPTYTYLVTFEEDSDRIISCSIIARSEEHTSELQSLMRISYAVFCLKKQNK